MRGEKALLELLAASPAALLVFHAALLRTARRLGLNASPQGWAFAALFLGFPILAAASWPVCLRWQAGAALAQTLAYLAIVYFCLGFFYFSMFNLSETSRRLKLLVALYLNGPASPDELRSLYPPFSQVDVRLDRLTAMGQIALDGGRYRLKGRFLWLAAVGLEAWRGILGFG